MKTLAEHTLIDELEAAARLKELAEQNYWATALRARNAGATNQTIAEVYGIKSEGTVRYHVKRLTGSDNTNQATRA